MAETRSIALIIAEEYGVAPEKFRIPTTPAEYSARDACIYALRLYKSLTYPEIAKHFQLTANGVYAALLRFKRKTDDCARVHSIFSPLVKDKQNLVSLTPPVQGISCKSRAGGVLLTRGIPLCNQKRGKVTIKRGRGTGKKRPA